jgi:hypothetical protein
VHKRRELRFRRERGRRHRTKEQGRSSLLMDPTAAELVDLFTVLSSSAEALGQSTAVLEVSAQHLENQAFRLAKDASYRFVTGAKLQVKANYVLHRQSCGSREEIWAPLLELWTRCAENLTSGDVLCLDVTLKTALLSRNLVAGVEHNQNSILFVVAACVSTR